MPKIARKRDDDSSRAGFRWGKAASSGQPSAAGPADTQGPTGSRGPATLLQRWQRRRGKQG
ncbi:MAG: hypothetical protein M3493_05735 [Actinomycetota bacterium]|jgi:hypothetical protein|nr:hypothetical protein [Euzebyaceae bacterium]MDQ3452188.1 hypothetical protein [Actinomycetota bacterium]